MTALLTATPVVRRIENAVEYATPTVNTAYLLPSAANVVGKLFTIYNNGTANSLVQASDGTAVVTVQPGTSAMVTPAQDAPTTSSQWICITNGVNASGVKGRTDGGTAPSDIVSYYVESKSASFVLSTTLTAALQITLPAGDWDIIGQLAVNGNPTTYLYLAVSTASASIGTLGDNAMQCEMNSSGRGSISVYVRASISASTIYYANMQAGVAQSAGASGAKLCARRR